MHTDNLFGDLVYQNLLKNLFWDMSLIPQISLKILSNSHGRFNSYRYYEIYPKSPPQLFYRVVTRDWYYWYFLFIIFILFLNYRIFHRSSFIEKKFLIFFNGYFWGASLVNFSYWQAWYS